MYNCFIVCYNKIKKGEMPNEHCNSNSAQFNAVIWHGLAEMISEGVWAARCDTHTPISMHKRNERRKLIMKKPFYLFFTPCNPIDVEPIDHGNILQPEPQQDRAVTISVRRRLLDAIPWVIGIGFIVLTFVLSFTLK